MEERAFSSNLCLQFELTSRSSPFIFPITMRELFLRLSTSNLDHILSIRNNLLQQIYGDCLEGLGIHPGGPGPPNDSGVFLHAALCEAKVHNSRFRSSIENLIASLSPSAYASQHSRTAFLRPPSGSRRRSFDMYHIKYDNGELEPFG